MQLSDHNVLITGGASGIGWALTQGFLKRRNQVIIVGRNQAKLDAAQAAFPNLITYRCDLQDPAAVEALSVQLINGHPDLNVLINNAGVQYAYQLLDEPHAVARIAQEVRINLGAPLQLTALLLPHLAQHEEAAVVNVTSALGVVPKSSVPVYSPTKAALRSFSQTLRIQLAATSVRVFELIPPFVDTDLTAGREGDKVAPEVVAEAFFEGFVNDKAEIRVGKVKLLLGLHRWLPAMARQIIEKKP